MLCRSSTLWWMSSFSRTNPAARFRRFGFCNVGRTNRSAACRLSRFDACSWLARRRGTLALRFALGPLGFAGSFTLSPDSLLSLSSLSPLPSNLSRLRSATNFCCTTRWSRLQAQVHRLLEGESQIVPHHLRRAGRLQQVPLLGKAIHPPSATSFSHFLFTCFPWCLSFLKSYVELFTQLHTSNDQIVFSLF